MERNAVARVFEGVDAIVSPTVTSVAAEVEGLDLGQVFASVFTNYGSTLGNPVINLPIGFSRAGLPVSFQIAGRPYEEAMLVAIGNQYQEATDWHLRVPRVSEGVFDV